MTHFKSREEELFFLLQSGKPFPPEKRFTDLLKMGVDLGKSHPDTGLTALHYALFHDHEDKKNIVRLLLDHGADIDAAEKRGNTALHIAVSQQDIQMVVLLIEKGAKLDIRDRNHNTALFLAVWNCHYDIVKILVEAGADIYLRDISNGLPVDIAQGFFNHKIVSLLQETDRKKREEAQKTEIHIKNGLPLVRDIPGAKTPRFRRKKGPQP